MPPDGQIVLAPITDKHASCTFCERRERPVVSLQSSSPYRNLIVHLCQHCLDIVRTGSLAVKIAEASAVSITAGIAAYEAQIVDTGKYQFTRGELRAAFNRVVCGMDNWKHPIDVVLALDNPERQTMELCRAVEFFAGCPATIVYTDDSTQTHPRVRVTAVGYYAAVGA